MATCWASVINFQIGLWLMIEAPPPLQSVDTLALLFIITHQVASHIVNLSSLISTRPNPRKCL